MSNHLERLKKPPLGIYFPFWPVFRDGMCHSLHPEKTIFEGHAIAPNRRGKRHNKTCVVHVQRIITLGNGAAKMLDCPDASSHIIFRAIVRQQQKMSGTWSEQSWNLQTLAWDRGAIRGLGPNMLDSKLFHEEDPVRVCLLFGMVKNHDGLLSKAVRCFRLAYGLKLMPLPQGLRDNLGEGG